MFIYKITNKISGKMYIGQTSKTIDYRWLIHLKNAKEKINRYLYDAINHYGYENFDIEEVEKCSSLNELKEKEMFYIKKYNSFMPNGYNMTLGGDGGNTLEHHPNKIEIIKKQIEKRIGQKRTKNQKKNMSIAATKRQRTYTAEQKEVISEKISETNKKRGIRPPEQYICKKGCIGFFIGKHHTSLAKKKISSSRKNKKYEDFLPENTIKRIKENKRNNWLGGKNPLYIDFSIEKKRKFISILLKNCDILLSDCKQLMGLSLYKLRIFLQENGIKNYQLFRKLDIEEQNKKLEDIKNALKN